MTEIRSICISAGELSGDEHAARVVAALRARLPGCTFRGMGGRHLREAGVDTIVDAERSASVMGFADVLFSARKVISAFRAMRRLLQSWQPDLLIVVDFPDFNLRLARIAKRLGIPVLYFIPPKLWAWRSGRMKQIASSVTAVASILPFERAFYESHGFKRFSYVGHPFATLEKPTGDREKILAAAGLDPKKPAVAFFPGSRTAEIRRILPICHEAFRLLKQRLPDVQGCIVAAPTRSDEELQAVLPEIADLPVIRGDAVQLLSVMDAALLKSGTCNLQGAYAGVPFAMVFRTGFFSALLARLLVPIRTFSLVNLIRPQTVREFVQDEARPELMARELEAMLTDSAYRGEMKRHLAEVVAALKTCDDDTRFREAPTAAERVAALACALPRRGAQSGAFLRRLLPRVRPYKMQLLFASLCMLVFGLSDGAVPLLVKQILDGIFATQNRDLLLLLPVAVMIFAFIRAASDFGQQFLMARIGHWVVRDLRNDVNRHLQTLSLSFFARHSTADLLARLTSDVALVRTVVTDALPSVVRDSIRVVGLLLVAISLDPYLALVAFVVFPIGIIPVVRFGRRMRQLSKRGQDEVGAISAMLQESTLGARVVRIFNRESHEVQRFEKKSEELTRTFIRSERVRAISGPVNEVLASFAISAIILYGGYSVIGGLRTQGDFIAFLIAVFLLYEPFKKLSRINSTIQQGAAGAERIFEVLDTKPLVAEPANPRAIPASNGIQFEGVTFTYPGSERPALTGISLNISEGEKVAFVGFSGSGKSTLVDCIARFIDPQEGVVRVGGVDVRTASLHALRARMSMVGQHTFLFNDTVLNNIWYGDLNASREQVMAAARTAFAHDFVMHLPQGYETVVGENGHTLSGGERQRIAIARALLKNAPILILDEATASLDNRSEQEVQQALQTLEEGRTTVVIAHRLSTVRDAHRIIVMRDSRIVEQGCHGDLLKRDGEYAKLYALQFRDELAANPPAALSVEG